MVQQYRRQTRDKSEKICDATDTVITPLRLPFLSDKPVKFKQIQKHIISRSSKQVYNNNNKGEVSANTMVKPGYVD